MTWAETVDLVERVFQPPIQVQTPSLASATKMEDYTTSRVDAWHTWSAELAAKSSWSSF
jgi:hypothetical protein